MEVIGEKSMTCTSPLKCGSLTICLAEDGFTLMMRLLPRFKTLHPYICGNTVQRVVQGAVEDWRSWAAPVCKFQMS